jgi:hypothetical protein
MPTWSWILILAALIKLPLAGLMLWIPIRYDEASTSTEPSDSSDEDGGSKALPGGPLNPHPRTPFPRRPRRGPHGTPSSPPPPRVRTHARGGRPSRVRISRV